MLDSLRLPAVTLEEALAAGGDDALVACMYAYADKHFLAMCVVEAVACLAQKPQRVKLLVDAGAVPALFFVLRRVPPDSDCAVSTCKALRAMIDCKAVPCKLLQPERLGEAMLRLLSHVDPSSGNAKKPLKVLVSLVQWEAGSLSGWRMPVQMALEAASDVADGLTRAHEDDGAGFCERACTLLSLLARRADLCARLAANADVPRALLARARNAALELPCIAALRHLSAAPASHAVLMRADSLPVLLRLLRANACSPTCSEHMLALVRNLCAVPANRGPLMAAGFGEAIAALVKFQEETIVVQGSFTSAAAIAWAACGALFGLACEPANSAALDAAGAASIAVRFLLRHKKHAGIVWAACGIILKLAETDELRGPLVQRDGAQTALTAAMLLHGSDARVAGAASAAVAKLTRFPASAPFLPTIGTAGTGTGSS